MPWQNQFLVPDHERFLAKDPHVMECDLINLFDAPEIFSRFTEALINLNHVRQMLVASFVQKLQLKNVGLGKHFDLRIFV
jgi:hypothetical protein